MLCLRDNLVELMIDRQMMFQALGGLMKQQHELRKLAKSFIIHVIDDVLAHRKRSNQLQQRTHTLS